MYTLVDFIKEKAAKSTTDVAIRDALNDDVEIVLYTDLEKVKKITDLFTKTNNIVLLFPVDSRNSGHYVALLYYPDMNAMSVFDPYGMSIFEDIQYATYLRKVDQRTRESLPRLIQESGLRVNINKIPFQELDDDIQTCAHHVVARILFRDIYHHSEYKKFMKYKSLNPDEIVTLMSL
jgi:hypothetical protein